MRMHPEEIKTAAKSLYLKRYTAKDIAETLNVPLRTVHHWCSSEEWDSLLSHESAEMAAQRRLAILLERDPKTPVELREIDVLIGSIERLQKLRINEKMAAQSLANAQNEGTSNAIIVTGKTAPSKKSKSRTKKNDVTSLTPLLFKEKFHTGFFEYQRAIVDTLQNRNRMLLKSRQIGFTWYFAQEAFENACLTGDNQIFLSATKAQSQVFRTYIMQLAGEYFDITLSGNPMILHTNNGPAELHFLSNNSLSAQSYHGHVYIDEFFWIRKFKELFKVATAMAAHKKWRRTLFSTPSAVTHEAYDLWSGKQYQKRFAKPKPWPDVKAIRQGIVCPDSYYRKIITLSDAEKAGCDLFDIAQLKLEYSPEEFRQLFGCEFIDDTQSVFTLPLLENCMADPADWEDVSPSNAHPVGNRPVWGGYDPARSRDDATFVVMLPPEKEGGDIRLIERHTWRGKTYLWQAERIKEIVERYHFTHLGIDTTGPGIGVYESVQQFLPLVTPINYSAGVKTSLVLKAREVMERQRLKFSAAETDIAHAFMTIRQTVTESGQIVYAASRNATTGHADAAWAIMHALAAEPLARSAQQQRCIVAIGE